MTIRFSREVLEEMAQAMKRQFSWARKQMMKHPINTPANNKWFELMLHTGLQSIELEKEAETAPRESNA